MHGTVIVDKTPFYATMGGQERRLRREITCASGRVRQVEDTIHLLGGKIGHVGHMAEGMIKNGDTVTLTVDEA